MPIFNSLEQALAPMPTVHNSLLPPKGTTKTPTPQSTPGKANKSQRKHTPAIAVPEAVQEVPEEEVSSSGHGRSVSNSSAATSVSEGKYQEYQSHRSTN
ncbi:Hypothetical predicted protein [Lecanosticta acicola]|uniref:Uncharacterized protein n=1 Tax=Lecanosticta acicola TaxID=111012 RepID=A0AAI9EDQ0_9PEZI|nr:Hypothetical predicted protein [Lecanosticta acicola]